MTLTTLDQHDTPQVRSAIREIFFLSSSRQSFSNAAQKERFFETWTGFYLQNARECIWLALDDQNVVRGYLMGAPDSRAALSYYESCNKSYALFADQFEQFPAHLHINLHPDTRGLGVGSQLLQKFILQMKIKGLRGAHLVTSPESRNRKFYQKNGFTFEIQRRWREMDLLFMGLILQQ